MSGPDARPLARPVADAPTGTLLDRVEDLARKWAIARVSEVPLQRLGEVPLAELATALPPVCRGAIGALASEDELERLLAEEGPARALGEVLRRDGAAAAVDGAELLRAVLWRALQEELREPDPRLVADLGERLAHVCARLASRMASVSTARAPGERERGGGEAAGAPRPIGGEAQAAPSEGDGRVDRILLIDELGEPDAGPIEVRDARPREGPGAWVDAIGRRLARYEREPAPFAVLLVDVVEIDASAEEQQPVAPTSLLARMEESLAAELEGEGSLTRERAGRYWVLSDDADPGAARALAERLERAVRLAVASPGRSFAAAVGIARAPQDGLTAAALASRADVAAFASRAAGRA